jgi:hypothetical protein
MRRRTRYALLIVVTIVALGLVATSLFGHDRSTAHPVGAGELGSATGPTCTPPGTAVDAGVEMGHAHDPQGATASAVAFARYAETAVGAPEATVVAAQNVMAADTSRAALVADTTTKLRALYAVYPADQLTYRLAILATRTTVHSADAVRVELWQVSVLTAPGIPTRQDWTTLTYELVWERNDWRVLTEAALPGPYPAIWPQTSPSSAGELEARLAGFTNGADG